MPQPLAERADSDNYLVAQQTVYQGAITRACLSIIVVHHHPFGDPTPSPEDVRTTEQLRKAGELLDIELLDHIIIGRHQHISLKERGLGF